MQGLPNCAGASQQVRRQQRQSLTAEPADDEPDVDPETDPDMPTLVPVAQAPQWAAGQAPEQAGKTWWDVNPRVRTAIETLCNETAEGMNRIAKQGGPELHWFNHFLRRKHKLHIAGITEDLDNGNVSIRIREIPPAQSRICRNDRRRWTLGQTLEWTLNERSGSYNWTLAFWERDFER